MAYDKIVDSAQLDAGLISVADAIRNKGGTTEPLEFPSGMVTAIESIQTGGGGDTNPTAQKGYVTFYDYDGTIRYSWTKAETQSATELPPLPTHVGLVCQGWNWSLADIKEQGREVNVGATYITDDGKTRIYVRLGESRKSPMMGIALRGTATINWGDGTTPDAITGTDLSTVIWTQRHEYQHGGDYVISIDVAPGSEISFKGDTKGSLILRDSNDGSNTDLSYIKRITHIEIGTRVHELLTRAFMKVGAELITISNDLKKISNYFADTASALTCVVFKNGLNTVGVTGMLRCSVLRTVIFPATITSIGANQFSNCSLLQTIDIPYRVTTIGASAFQACEGLTDITIPASVTSIGAYAFGACSSLGRVRFLAEVPPSFASADVFGSVPADCVFEVPSGYLEAYQNATNYSGIASQMVEATA